MKYRVRQIWKVTGGPQLGKWGVEYPNGEVDYVATREKARELARENANLQGEGTNYFVPKGARLY